jgi:hypothetical protein
MILVIVEGTNWQFEISNDEALLKNLLSWIDERFGPRKLRIVL